MNDPKPTAPLYSGAPPTQEERTWAMFAHLSAFAVFVFPLAGNVIAPLIIWLARRETSAFVALEAKEALNFNITVAIGWLICSVLIFVLIGVPLAAVLSLYWIIMAVLAGVKASEGVGYRYPFILRLVK